jgi:hypothetical protein
MKLVSKAIERIMKDGTNRAIFLEPNNDLCSVLLEHIEGWLAQKLERYDDPNAYHENEHVKVSKATTE